MRPTATTALWLLCSAALLTGCAERTVTVTQVEVHRQEIPTPLRVCQPPPVVPVCATQRCVAAYLVRVSAAGDDCRATVARVKEWAERPPPVPSASAPHRLQARSPLDRMLRWLATGLGTLPVEVAMGPE